MKKKYINNLVCILLAIVFMLETVSVYAIEKRRYY